MAFSEKLLKLWSSMGSIFNFQGTQRSQSLYFLGDNTSIGRNYDLEITEHPIRDVEIASKLIEMWHFCPEVATAIDIIASDVFASDDGDDQGFYIADTLNDNETAIDPKVYDILNRLIEDVLGGLNCYRAVEWLLMFGDSFANLSINIPARKVDGLLFLPTWEVFRIENNRGKLLGFQQRKWLSNSEQSAINFHPFQIVHWRYRRKYLYGRSQFLESIRDWDNLKNATFDLANASRSLGINPNIHLMPQCATDEYLKAYKSAYEAQKTRGTVTDFYLTNGADIKKLSQLNPDLKAMSDTVLMWRSRIAMRSRVPPWLLGLPTIGAREIAGQPALAYARFVNGVRMVFVDGLKEVCDIELSLNGIPKEQWNYRICFPKIATNVYGNNTILDDESNHSQVEDLDDAN
jgi:hypothetical protein